MKDVGYLLNLVFLFILFLNTASAQSRDVCGPNDFRKPSDIKPIARMMYTSGTVSGNGCTATLFSKSCMISAGHCTSNFEYAQFNVPKSLESGLLNPPNPEDQYEVSSIIGFLDNDNGDSNNGQDWAVFSLKKNLLSGKYPGDVQGYYRLNFNNPTQFIGEIVRLTGYGIANGEKNCTQQTSVGILFFNPKVPVVGYDAYTRVGNSGSAVILEQSQEIIGVHTETGCYQGGPKINSGSSLWGNPSLAAAVQKCMELEAQNL